MTSRSPASRQNRSAFRRTLAVGLAMGLAGLVGAPQLGAQGIAGHNSDAPVDFSADRIELQDKQKRVILAGNVDVTQGALRLRAARTTVAYTDGDSLKVRRMDASGGVLVTRGTESARGDVAIYDFDRRIITMVGNVALRRGSDNLNGGRLVMDLNTGVSSVDGSGGGAAGVGASRGGRVHGSFAVPKRGGA